VGSRKNPSLILKKKNTVSFSDYSPIKGGFSPLKGGRAITAKANGRTASFFDFKREVGQT